MATWEAICEIVAALPGTELDQGVENPAWRVNGKVLVRRNPRLRVPGEEPLRQGHGEPIAIRVDRGEREALLQEDPETYLVTPHWETSPSVLVWLSRASTEQLRELIVEAWLARAPKRLARSLQTET